MNVDTITALNEIEKIHYEIYDAWEKWDTRILTGQQPVPIQDLDYWSETIRRAHKILKEALQ